MSGWGAIIALGAIAVLFFTVIGLVFYVLKSIGLYTLAENRGIENPWLAWIPVADLYIMGLLVGEMDILDYHLDNLGLWCPVIFVGGLISTGIPFIGVLVKVALFVFAAYFAYKLFEKYTPQAVLYTVLSALIPGLFAIFLFVIRNNAIIQSDDPSAQPPATY